MTPIIDDYVGKYYQKKEQSIDNQQKGFFAPLFSLHVFFYLRGLCASFCIRKDTLLTKITKKNDNRLEKGLIGRQW